MLSSDMTLGLFGDCRSSG